VVDLPDHPRRRGLRPRLQPDHARVHQARGASCFFSVSPVGGSDWGRARDDDVWTGPSLTRPPSPPLFILKTKQFPNAASDPQGDHGRQLQTLEDAYREHLLERAVDAALADARAGNASKAAAKAAPAAAAGAAADGAGRDGTQPPAEQPKRRFWSRSGGGSSADGSSSAAAAK